MFPVPTAFIFVKISIHSMYTPVQMFGITPLKHGHVFSVISQSSFI